MSMIDFLKPPMFPKPKDIYLPLHKFSAEPTKLDQEINDAIAVLNLQARDFSSSNSFYREYD